ncbi:MAG TPA: hypothetical protein VJ874_01080 [Candidatus Thermoplasmatota archaeon]|nr:hypothetical protein [Candidatus Thermoplasmatota archaeon]
MRPSYLRGAGLGFLFAVLVALAGLGVLAQGKATGLGWAFVSIAAVLAALALMSLIRGTAARDR